MAIESVTANAGTGGADFAVDTITGSVQVPYVKLMSGTDAAEDLIGGDATNGLDVDVTRVSGTVAVSNAGLTELAAAINASSQMDVNIAASAATVAVSNAGLTALNAAISTEVQVDVVGALPAGTNAIGKLAANSGVDIGDVDVTSVTPGTTASSLGKAEDAAHSSGDVGVLAMAVRRDAAAVGSDTDGDYSTLNVDASGRLHVNVGNTVTVGSHAVTNAGTFAVQVDGSALTALQVIDNPVIVDDAAFTPATTSVMMAGFEADEGSTDSVDEGDGGAARMTLDRKVIVTPYPHTAGGLTIFRSIDLDETEEEVKATAGQIYGMWVTNTATSTRFIKFYNLTAANTSVGSSTPVITWGIPGNSSDDVSAVFGGGMGIAFDTAISVAATTGVADADTGAPGANEVVINIFYK
jgi:hypothetical protein